MSVLIIKLGAAGDVVRTTPLLRRLTGSVSWTTAKNNLPLRSYSCFSGRGWGCGQQ
jgi:hypothetical protein